MTGIRTETPTKRARIESDATTPRHPHSTTHQNERPSEPNLAPHRGMP